MTVELTPKKAAQKLLERVDEDASYDDIIYELHVLQKIQQGLKDVEEGKTKSHEQVKEEFKKWLT